jgi:hypothetical protein
MTATEPSELVLHADKEHGGLRVAILAILIISIVLLFLLLNALFSGASSNLVVSYAGVLSCLLAVPLGLGAAALSEQLLKQRWHSGRYVSLDGDSIRAVSPPEAVIDFDLSKRFMVTRWFFALKGFPRGGRERRVPASWYCLACELQQDEHRLVVFSYIQPNEAQQWINEDAYQEIKPGDFFESNPLRRRFAAPTRPEVPTSVLTGKDGRFWLAERRRWENGMELISADYQTLMSQVGEYEAAWVG